MADYLKVSGHDGLVRDVGSKAIVNTNQTEYQRYLASRKALQDRQDQLDRHERDINSIKTDITEIKAMMLELLRK